MANLQGNIIEAGLVLALGLVLFAGLVLGNASLVQGIAEAIIVVAALVAILVGIVRN